MEATTVSMLVLGAIALLIPAGTIIYGCGLSRSKNSAAALVRGLLVLATAVLAFWLIGDAILESAGGAFLGFDLGRFADAHGRMNVATFPYLCTVLISVVPLAAALGERARVVVRRIRDEEEACCDVCGVGIVVVRVVFASSADDGG